MNKACVKAFSSKGRAIKDTTADKIFMTVLYAVLFVVLVIVVYPLLFVVLASVSDSRFVNSGDLLLWPKGFTMMGYELAFRDTRIFTGYANTLLYTVAGALLATFTNILAGYALSRKDLPGRGLVMAFIDQHQEDGSLNVSMLADTFHLEISNLSHQFKNRTGYALSDYLNARKLDAACTKLRDTNQSVAAIAESLGYAHASSFIRMFKKVYGMTPTQFRVEAQNPFASDYENPNP